MKRAMLYLCLAVFAWLVIQPNLLHADPAPVRIPENTDEATSAQEISTRQSKSKSTIVIDPGHGGNDLGYAEEGKAPEKDISMQLAVNIGDCLERAGYNVAYTRWYDDTTQWNPDLSSDQNRITQAKTNHANYVLAIRFTTGDSMEKGYTVFTRSDNEQLEELGNAIAEKIKGTGYSTCQGVDLDHFDNFALLADPSLPAVLVQMGYLTNDQDYSKITDSTFQKNIGEAVTAAFLDTID